MALNRLETLRGRLKRALVNLRQRLVAIYTYGSTEDIASVVLAAEDYGDMVARTEYFEAIRDSDQGAGRAGPDPARRSEETGAGAQDRETDDRRRRDADRRQGAAAGLTRSSLESREGALLAARAERRQTLTGSKATATSTRKSLPTCEPVAQEIAEATGGMPLPAGPLPLAERGGADLADRRDRHLGLRLPLGTDARGHRHRRPRRAPIRAAASGTVILMQSEYESGGYGNYTCIDHGGGALHLLRPPVELRHLDGGQRSARAT